MTGHYKQRLESHIFEIITDLLATEARDPRLEDVVVTGVELNEDYSVAKVFTMGGCEDSSKALRRAASFLRVAVGRFLKMKTPPELRFYEDESLDRYNRVTEILEDEHPAAAAQDLEVVDAAPEREAEDPAPESDAPERS